jgi:hypothetical protein
MRQPTLTESFNNDEEKHAVKHKSTTEGFAEHFLDELEQKYNWHEEVLPYAHLYKYSMYKHAINEKRVRIPKLPNNPFFEFPSTVDVVEEFFHKGKPISNYLGQYIEQWILFFVTEGRYRSNANQGLFMYAKERGDLNWMTWSTVLQQSSPADWTSIHDDIKYNAFIQITEQCNAVLSRLMKRLRRTKIHTNYRKVVFTNLQNLPEFVPFQQNRNNLHKQFRWYFQPVKKGGNAGYKKAAKAERFPKPSIQAMLKEYGEWLPSFRKRKDIKKDQPV